MAKPNRKVKPGTPHPTRKGLVMGHNGSYVSKTTFIRQKKAAAKGGPIVKAESSATSKPNQGGDGLARRPVNRPANRGGGGGGGSTNSSRSGGLSQRGGLATNDPIQRVKVRDVTGQNPSRPLSPGKPGGALKIARSGAASTAANTASKTLGFIGAALGTADAAKKVFNPKDNMVTNVRDLVASIKNKGQVGPGHSRFIGPVDTPQRSNKSGRGQGNRSVASNPNRGGGSRTPNKPTAAQIEALTAPGGIFHRGGGGSKPADKNNGGTVKGSGKSGNTATTKPAPKPRKPVPSAKETYRDGGKGLYQGSKAYRAALAKKSGGESSGNPLLDRFRKDMGRNPATGEKPASKPASKRGSGASSTFANNRLAIDSKKGGSFNTRGLFGSKKDKKKKK